MQDNKKSKSKLIAELESLRKRVADLESNRRDVAYDILNTSPLVAFVCRNEEDWPVEFVTDNVASVLGYSAKDLLSGTAKVKQIIVPDDLKHVEQEVASLDAEAARTVVRHRPYRMRKKNGDLIWVEGRTHLKTDREGRIIQYQGVILDITERISSEKALWESNQKLRLVLDNIPERVFWKDVNSVYLGCNEPFAKEAGFNTPNDLIGKTDFDCTWSNKEAECYRHDDRAVMESGQSRLNFEERQTQSDGRTRWVQTSKIPIRDKNGEISGVLGTYDDITKRKKNEESLKITQFSFDNAAVGIWRLSSDAKILKVNKKVAETLGYTIEELESMSLKDIVPYLDDKLWDEIWRDFLNVKYQNFPSVHRAKNGKDIPVEISSSLLEIDGQPCAVAFSTDISERKRAEEEKSALEKQLRQSQKLEALGTLAGGIAHDFNNILSAIIGYTELGMLELGKSSPSVSENLESVIYAGNRAKELVGQILTFSRRHEQNFSPVQIAPIVKEALKLLQVSLPENIELKSKIESQDRVMADPTQIHQVVINLCTNAFHAMEIGSGKLTVTLASVSKGDLGFFKDDELPAGDYVILSVADNGKGINPENLDRVFDPYFSTKKQDKGSGLGLAVVHGIIQAHAGVISVESNPDKGTVFHVILPVTDKPYESEHDLKKIMPRGNEHILLVDDNKIVVDVSQKILDKLGYQVTGVDSGEKALEVFNDDPTRFDVVLTDLSMPKMTGDKLAEKITKIRNEVPVILCTGYSDKMNEKQAKSLGIKKTLMKPLSMKVLAEAIREVLDN